MSVIFSEEIVSSVTARSRPSMHLAVKPRIEFFKSGNDAFVVVSRRWRYRWLRSRI